MQKVTLLCDFCGEVIDRVEKNARNPEFKVKMRPGGNWEYEDDQPYLDLCPECEKVIREVLKSRYDIGIAKEVDDDE